MAGIVTPLGSERDRRATSCHRGVLHADKCPVLAVYYSALTLCAGGLRVLHSYLRALRRLQDLRTLRVENNCPDRSDRLCFISARAHGGTERLCVPSPDPRGVRRHVHNVTPFCVMCLKKLWRVPSDAAAGHTDPRACHGRPGPTEEVSSNLIL